MLYEHAGQKCLWFSVSFVVTGGRSWSFQSLNLEVFKTEQKKLFVIISTILCADSLATYVSLDQILCHNPFTGNSAIWRSGTLIKIV